MRYDESVRRYAETMTGLCMENNYIPDEKYKELGVYRGLRDLNGKGVLTGLTGISEINSFRTIDGERVPIDGELWYRGYRVEDLVRKYSTDVFGFEKTTYLLLFGNLPDEAESQLFVHMLEEVRTLPGNFVRDVIMKAPTRDIMNSMARSILTLSSYDENYMLTDITDEIRKSIMLISTFPMLAIYAYHAYNHYQNLSSMYIHRPGPQMSTAENILAMLRPDQKYTKLEAEVLDVALVLHAEHGGGNNSTFTTRVVTSSGSDIYSAIAAAMSSLKGPRHGGANIKVMEMMADIRAHVTDWNDKDAIYDYLNKILEGEAFDRKGLIYGMGHAIYSKSDPRERIFREYVGRLAEDKGRMNELALYRAIEEIAPVVINDHRKIYKGVSPNIDFYSGFVYDMLGIPQALYTPLFAVARIAGWCAHRLEEITGKGKIIRPAYQSVMKKR